MNTKFEKLLEVTAEYMAKKKISNLPFKEPSSRADSCWGIITQTLYNRFCRHKSLQIYTMWKRDTNNYKANVQKILDKLNHKADKRM